MTVAALTSTITYIEDGSTVAFPVPFRFKSPSHLTATRLFADGSKTTLAFGAGFSATGGEFDTGGTLTVSVAAAAGTKLKIDRRTPRAQTMDYTTNDRFPAESHELALDTLTLIAQDVGALAEDTNSRAILVPIGELGSELPRAAARTGGGLVLAPDPTTGAIGIRTIEDVGRGASGPANSTYPDRATMVTSANPTNVSAIVAGDGTFTWKAGDLSALIAAEPSNFVASAYPGAAAGAWVRVPGEGGFTSLAALKLGAYPVGRAIPAAIYGGSMWVARATVELQPDFYGTAMGDINNARQASVVDFDDEMHLTVNLVGSGTGVLELQLASVAGYLRQRHDASERNVRNRLMQSQSVGTPSTFAVYGDSVPFGQYDGTGAAGVTANATPKTGVATAFGDGSVHAHNQIAAPYPETMFSLFEQVFGSGKTTMSNRGFSGDRVGCGYRRHRVDAGEMACLIDYGRNDVNFATVNGTDQTGLFVATSPGTTPNYRGGYTTAYFIDAYRKFVARKILRGAMVTLVAPAAFSSASGYNGTTYAAAQLMIAYAGAIDAIGAEYGIDVIHEAETVALFGNSEVTHDGIHPNDFGALYRATRYVPYFVAGGLKGAARIVGTRRLTANKLLEPVQVGHGLDNVTSANIPSANSLAAPFYTAANSASFVLGTGGTSQPLYLVFFLEEDFKAVMPVGFTSAAAAVQYQLNFNATQPKRRLDTVPTAVRGTHPSWASQISLNPGGATDYNDPGDIAGHLTVIGRGLHILGINATSGAFALDGFLFGDFGDIGAAIPSPTLAAALTAPSGGATTDAEARAAIVALIASNQQLETRLTAALARLRYSHEILP